MQVKEMMVDKVQTCSPSDRLNRAAQIMWEHDCGVVPVVDGQMKVMGMITDRDVCMAAYTKGLPLDSMHVADVMTKQVVECHPEDMLVDAETAMRSKRVRRLPVTDESGRLVGILSLNDLARSATSRTKNGLDTKQLVETMSAICQPRRIAVPVPVPAKGGILGAKGTTVRTSSRA